MSAVFGELGGALTRLLRGGKVAATALGGVPAGSELWSSMGAVSKVGVGALGAKTAYDLVGAPVLGNIRDALDGRDRLKAAVDAEGMMRSRAAAAVLRRERIKRDMAANTARLAAGAPDVYAQLVAGQTMPQGSTMIGGEQNFDLVNEVAMMMSEGGFGPPQ